MAVTTESDGQEEKQIQRRTDDWVVKLAQARLNMHALKSVLGVER